MKFAKCSELRALEVKGWVTCTAFTRETGVYVSTSRSLNLTAGSLCLSLCHEKCRVERISSSKRGYSALTGDDKRCRVCLGKCMIKRHWLDNRKGCSYIRSFKHKKLPNDPIVSAFHHLLPTWFVGVVLLCAIICFV